MPHQSNPNKVVYTGPFMDITEVMYQDSDGVNQPTDDGKVLLRDASFSVRPANPPGTVVGTDDQLKNFIALNDARASGFQGVGSAKLNAVLASWHTFMAGQHATKQAAQIARGDLPHRGH